MSESNLEIAKQYLAALEAGTTGEELASFFTEDVIQEEFPNRLLPQGASRDLSAILEGAERGKQFMQMQRYELVNTLATGQTVILEVKWVAVVGTDVGTLRAGTQLQARLAVFLEFRDGKIWRQRNYDCFEPWETSATDALN